MGEQDKHTARKMNSSAVKSIPLFVVAAIALTFVLYMLCSVFLPPPKPSTSETSLLAFISMTLVYVTRVLYLRIRKKPNSQ